MDKIFEKLHKIGIVPVVVIDSAEDAVPLAQALTEGGLPAAEVTFRTAAAKDAIKRIREACPDMTVGAGTVLSVSQAKDAAEAGAQFIVSPGLDVSVVTYCKEAGIPVLPGCANPSDIQRAIGLGLSEVKFFPAEQLGGLEMIKALSAPFGNMRFMPTGGLNEKNIGEYLAEPSVIACGGSFMVKKELIAAGRFDKIKELTESAVRLMLNFTFVGVEKADGEEKIVMQTSDLERAVYHLERKGVRTDEASEVRENGRLVRADCSNGIRLIQKV